MARPKKLAAESTPVDTKPFTGMTLAEAALYAQKLDEQTREEKRQQYQPWNFVAAQLKAKGWTNVNIAEHVTKNEVTISRLFRDHPELIEWGIQKCSNPEAIFYPLIPRASEVYREVLDLDPQDAATHKVRTEVARDVFDRSFGKPVQRNITDSRGHITIEFVDSSPTAASKNQEDVLAQLGAGKVIEGEVL